MTRKNKSLPEWDDGRVICPMDVEGMPWEKKKSLFGKSRDRDETSAPTEQMSGQQVRMYTAGAVKAGLLVIGVFAIGLILFTLFCTNIWFK